MRFTDSTGRTATAEPWSPGPLYGTVWALTETGTPVVIHATKGLEIAWEQPEQPAQHMDYDLVESAREVLHRHFVTATAHSRDWYKRKYLVKEADYSVEPPTKEQVDAARAILAIAEHNRSVYRIYREAHIASTPISAKRLMELWMKGEGE